MTTQTLAPAPADVQLDLRFEPGTVKPSGGVQVMVVYGQHACRWCGGHDCESRFDHEREFMSGETYWRMSPAARRECPSCHDNALDGKACVSVSTTPIGADR